MRLEKYAWVLQMKFYQLRADGFKMVANFPLDVTASSAFHGITDTVTEPGGGTWSESSLSKV